MATKKSVGSKVKKAVKAVKKAVKKGDYSLEVSVNDNVFKTTSDSVVEALSSFVESSSFPVAIKTKAIIRVGNFNSEYQWVLPTVLARRMFKIISKKPDALELMAERLIGKLD